MSFVNTLGQGMGMDKMGGNMDSFMSSPSLSPQDSNDPRKKKFQLSSFLQSLGQGMGMNSPYGGTASPHPAMQQQNPMMRQYPIGPTYNPYGY